jgi:hypothetical protein
MGLYRLDAGGERGSEQWLTQMEGIKTAPRPEDAIEDKKQRGILIELMKDEGRVMRSSGFAR